MLVGLIQSQKITEEI